MRALALAALLLPAVAGAAAPGDPVRAARLASPIEIDGRLEEPAWDAAPAHDGFVQLFPDEGKAPSERTEVRVLYDDRNLYVGVVCHDSRPEEIRRPLGRRDVIPFSDKVAIFIDSNHDRRTAYVFEVNAAGVQFDELLFGDDQENSDWDAVWEVATASTRDGWSAEFRLPLAVFRFSTAPTQTWGLAVRRVVARTREELVSINLKRGDRGIVAHFGDLTGLDGLEPVQDLSFAPYLAARVSAHPQYADDPTRPRPRLVDPSADLGLDVRASLGRGLLLQATLNPDFGQVEADQLVQNLSTFELFFPEKRPFFTQGLELFQGPTPHNQPSPQQLFYSRRIGLDAPILAAAKLTGRAGDEVQIGILQALVTGAAAPDGSTEEAPARGYHFAGQQPLHFARAGAYPATAPATRSFLAGVARWQPAATATFGLSASNALPLDRSCTTEQASTSDARPAVCDVLAGTGVALDWNVRSADSEWFVRGQLSGSHYAGGEFTPQEAPPIGEPPSARRVLADGTAMTPGDLGWGGFVAFGRNGGEPWRFDVDVEYESPRLELNALGYQRTQNEMRLRPIGRYVRPTGGGPFHSIVHGLGADLRATTDGTLRRRAATFFYFNELQLKTYQTFGCEADLDLQADDVREIYQTGIAFGRPGSWSANCYVNGDQSQPLYWELWGGVGRSFPSAVVSAPAFGWAGGLLSIRPHPSAETRISLSWEQDAWPARWVETLPTGEQLFAQLTSPFASLAVRQLLHLTPRLTIQVYGQLFVATGRYGPYYTGSAGPGGLIRATALVPGGVPTADPGFHRTDLVLNALLRWDYRVGATVFLVYSRSSSEPGLGAGELPGTGLSPRGLTGGPTTDTFQVKWTWYWAA